MTIRGKCESGRNGAVVLVLASLFFLAGCSSRLSPARLARAFRPIRQPAERVQPQSPAQPKSPQQLRAPAAIDRAIEMQTQRAFDPLRDDARLRSLRDAAQFNPENALLRLQLAQRYEAYGLADFAMHEYSALAKDLRSREPGGDAAVIPSARLQALLGVARNGLQASRAAEAVEVIEEAAEVAASGELSLRLGLLYDQAGEPKKAESAYRLAVRLEPDSAIARNNLGYRLMQRGDLDEAERQFRAAIAGGEGAASAHNNLGMLLTQRGDHAAAWEQFQTGAADAATARNNYAVALMSAGKWLESREQLLLALRERRGFAPALRNFQIVQQRIAKQGPVAGGRAGE